MKFVQVYKFVALCLCLGVARSCLCIGEGGSCSTGETLDCCKYLHCVKAVGQDDKTCEKPGRGKGTDKHCIPEGKQCNNGARPHDCCEGLGCLLTDTNRFHCISVHWY